jgi:hypothetical protein
LDSTVLEVSSLHAVPNPTLPCINWSAAPSFPLWVPFCNLSSNSAVHSLDVAVPS